MTELEQLEQAFAEHLKACPTCQQPHQLCELGARLLDDWFRCLMRTPHDKSLGR